MERKTHRESWKGEESVKERITLTEPQVIPFLEGRFKIEDVLKDQKVNGVVGLMAEVNMMVEKHHGRMPTSRTGARL